MKILVVGGHHTSSLEVAKGLRKKGHDVLWVGHMHSMLRDESVSAEYSEVSQANIEFVELTTGKYHRQSKLDFAWKLTKGFLNSRQIIKRFKPRLIYSAGGYLSPPIVLAGKLAGVKIVLHEHTRTVGQANFLTARWADVILTTWPDIKLSFDATKTKCVGLPLRPEIVKILHRKPSKLTDSLLIFGGKQGSRLINQTVFAVLDKLSGEFAHIYHQTGGADQAEDFKKAQNLAKKTKGYQPAKYFYPPEIAKIYQRSRMVISRAGAHSTYELALLGLPCVLVPIPWAAKNEQQLNAEYTATYGRAEILQQADLTGTNLLAAMMKASRRPPRPLPDLPLNATEKTIQIIEQLLLQ